MPFYQAPSNPLLPQMSPQDSVMGMASPMGMAAAPFASEVEPGLARVAQLYRNFNNYPLKYALGAPEAVPTEGRSLVMAPLRRYMDQFGAELPEQAKEYIRNAFLSGVEHGSKVVSGVK